MFASNCIAAAIDIVCPKARHRLRAYKLTSNVQGVPRDNLSTLPERLPEKSVDCIALHPVPARLVACVQVSTDTCKDNNVARLTVQFMKCSN